MLERRRHCSTNRPGHPELEGVEGNAAVGRCPANAEDGDLYFFEDEHAEVVLESPGRYCFAAWSVDSTDATFGPATVWFDYAGQPGFESP